ncbi:NUDIX hydrolase domain-like protein [Aspergillus pseudotamarii]|uniref:NUDIX hydrolase domain-like protein n=1 Tax=Aspergillus pseudotamarii TaxID=132259 RepID=A0A5N6T1R1_ASPPS|nr:NUDIX hydrolase domain-like protein [Aspergillus pseudotamarii]KAE8140219.1 NUDIX hydrolase domain-like protein [Aspergillus pseudotamarii]
MPDFKYAKPVILSRRTLDTKEAEWKRLVKTTYRDPNGVQRIWESAEMQTRPADSDFDGVSIVATLNKSTGPELVLLKQYRPALDKVVIEIPGGLIDPGETAEQCAVRELKEETGFVGEAERTSRTLFNSPGFCNNNFKLVYVNVDLSLPENQNPSPELEEEEFIEVFMLPMKSLFSEIKRLEKEGFAIETRVVALAEGLELARKWNL